MSHLSPLSEFGISDVSPFHGAGAGLGISTTSPPPSYESSGKSAFLHLKVSNDDIDLSSFNNTRSEIADDDTSGATSSLTDQQCNSSLSTDAHGDDTSNRSEKSSAKLKHPRSMKEIAKRSFIRSKSKEERAQEILNDLRVKSNTLPIPSSPADPILDISNEIEISDAATVSPSSSLSSHSKPVDDDDDMLAAFRLRSSQPFSSIDFSSVGAKNNSVNATDVDMLNTLKSVERTTISESQYSKETFDEPYDDDFAVDDEHSVKDPIIQLKSPKLPPAIVPANSLDEIRSRWLSAASLDKMMMVTSAQEEEGRTTNPLLS